MGVASVTMASAMTAVVFQMKQAATPLRAVPAWFWYTASLYRYSSTVTAPFSSPLVALIYIGFLTLLLSPYFSHPPLFNDKMPDVIYIWKGVLPNVVFLQGPWLDDGEKQVAQLLQSASR